MTHNSREWEVRFDERFIPNDGDIPTYIENGNDLKEFLHQELQKARHDWLQEEIVKLVQDLREARFTFNQTAIQRDKVLKYGYGIKIETLLTIIDRYQSELDQPITSE